MRYIIFLAFLITILFSSPIVEDNIDLLERLYTKYLPDGQKFNIPNFVDWVQKDVPEFCIFKKKEINKLLDNYFLFQSFSMIERGTHPEDALSQVKGLSLESFERNNLDL